MKTSFLADIGPVDQIIAKVQGMSNVAQACWVLAVGLGYTLLFFGVLFWASKRGWFIDKH